jgi:hypothetical protein
VNTQKLLETNAISKFVVGSNLYGTNVPTSDIDYVGFFIPPFESLFGLSLVEQIDSSTISKNESGKNDKDAIDVQFYSVQKFARLALAGNPNLIELLFVPDSCIVFENDLSKKLRENFHLFIGQQIIPRFLGYAHSQRHKMVLKSSNFNELHTFKEFLLKFDLNDLIIEIKNDEKHSKFCKIIGDEIHVGDVKIQRTASFKKALSILNERIDKGTNRQDIILKHGFDTKFASHLLRLLYECQEMLKTGKIVFPLQNAEFLKEVKDGQLELTEILKIAENLEDEIRSFLESGKSILPKVGNFKEVENLVIEITKQFYF